MAIPQGGIISPLLANIFLHQLDEYMIVRITGLRKQLKQKQGKGRTETVKELRRLERKLKKTPE